MSSFDTQLEAWRDQVLGQSSSFEVGVIDKLWSQRYAVALDDLNPLYFDEEYAQAQGYRGLIAPPNYVTTLRAQATPGPFEAEMRPDGLALTAGPPVPGLAAMGGGQDIQFHSPVYCGEHILAQRKIVRVERRNGRSGEFVVVDEEIDYCSAAGEAKVTLTNTVLYRIVGQEV